LQHFSPDFIKAAADPVFSPKPIDPEGNDVIRLDYGEFEAPVPDAIVKGLFKGFLESQNHGLEELVKGRVSAYLKTTRQICAEPQKLVLSQGVFPLFGALITALKNRLQRPPVVALPNGSYGPIYPTIAYYGGIVEDIETDPQKGFLLNACQLTKMKVKPDLLWLTQPNNPSGLFFEPQEVQSIAEYCSENGIYLMADEIFLLLSDHRLGAMTPPYLSFASTLRHSSRNTFIVDGLSKAFAAGGMRCGFMLCPDEGWAKDIQLSTYLPPQSGLRAWDALYSAFLDDSPHQFVNVAKERQALEQYLDFARRRLSAQRDELVAVLRKHKRDDGLDTPYRGGFFLLAKLDSEGESLARDTKLLVNPPQWGRTPGWSRLCYSLEPERFREAIARLSSYLETAN
jgi:aspartate/methionine/tyrosine aminotransferase